MHQKKTVVVTGGSKGIGLGIVRKYLDNNYTAVSISRNNFTNISKHHHHIICDLSDWEETLKLKDKLLNCNFNTIDVLVNNVGKSEWRSIEEVSLNFFNEMIKLNVGSYISVTQSLLTLLNKNSVITNISSMAGKRGTSNNSVYCATKFAINGITQSLAKELGKRGIRVNALCPVLVKSDGLVEALERKGAPAFDIGVEEFLKQFTINQAALNQLPTVFDVANMTYFLSSENASSITGQCINVDSGVFPQ